MRKLTEAMKELKIIEKKMSKNILLIEKYASQPSTDRLYFGERDAQEAEIKSLIQSNHDLSTEYLRIKIAIERTNLATVVEFHGRHISIAELLVFKRKLCTGLIGTYNALDDRGTRTTMRGSLSTGEKVTIERFYSEKFKNDSLRDWQDFYESIDGRLEVVNATTDLLE